MRAAELHIYDPTPRYIDTMFFPSEDNVEKLKNYIYKTKKILKICVFNFTNNQLRNAVLDVWDTGAEVKIITDDETMKNRGNDIQFLVDKGIPVRTDNSERNHMHNKYIVVDNKFVVTGSFNWTVQAVDSNQENLLVVDHPYYIHQYDENFEDLWDEFEAQQCEASGKSYNKREKKRTQNLKS